MHLNAQPPVKKAQLTTIARRISFEKGSELADEALRVTNGDACRALDYLKGQIRQVEVHGAAGAWGLLVGAPKPGETPGPTAAIPRKQIGTASSRPLRPKQNHCKPKIQNHVPIQPVFVPEEIREELQT